MEPVLIFISGWSSPCVEWSVSPIKSSLGMWGYETEEFKHKKLGFGCITKTARALAKRVQYYNEIGREVHLIGYSMGGLVALESANYARPTSIITIGTPHRGTVLARLSKGSTSARQMRPESELVERTSQQKATPILSIACRYDGFIIPRGSAIHPHSVDHMWINHSHITGIFSRKVARKIMEFLKSLSNTTNVT